MTRTESIAARFASRGLSHLWDPKRWHCTAEQLASSRIAHAVKARVAIMRALRRLGMSSTAIGAMFDIDHTTVLHHLKKGTV